MMSSNMGSTEWLIPCILLCSFGFFKETLPSEPFLTPYLVYYKNISEEAVTNKIYPTWTYSFLVALIPVFLFTDALRYKPVIIFEGCSFIATYALLLWASGVPLMRLMQMFYAFATASEIAYYSYIYAAVSSEHYKQVSSYTRSAVLIGNFVAGAVGQLLYSLVESEHVLYTLHVMSMCSVALATALSLFLPKVDSSTYFHQRTYRKGVKDHENCDIQLLENIKKDDTQVAENCTQKAESDTQQAENGTQDLEDGILEAENDIQESKYDTRETKSDAQQSEIETQQAKNCIQQGENCTLKAETSALQVHIYCNPSSSHALNGMPWTSAKQDDTEDVRTSVNLSIGNQNETTEVNKRTWRDKLIVMWLDFKTSYSNKQLLKWSLWWAFATCGAHQVSNFIQTLWQIFFREPDTNINIVYNGAVEAASTLAGAVAAFCIMFTKLNWDIFGEIFIGFVSVVDSVLLVTMAMTQSIWLCYVFYVIFRASYQLVKTIATYQIAKHLTKQRYGLVFGCNTFVAAALQSLLTLVVVDHLLLSASPRTQFLIYGGCFFVLGLLFCCKAVYTITVDGWCWSWRNRYGATGSEEGTDDMTKA